MQHWVEVEQENTGWHCGNLPYHTSGWVLSRSLSSSQSSGSQPPRSHPLVANLKPQDSSYPLEARLFGREFQVLATLWLKEYCLMSSLDLVSLTLCTPATSLVLGLAKRKVEDTEIGEILGESGEQEEDEKVPDDKVKESKEIQRHDRMAQVKHEDSKPRQINPETEARTVFVGNLPSSTKKQVVKTLFSQFGKVETVRFRCAARPDMKTTKKVAVITHKFHEERNNINAYVRMSSIKEAVAACSLNNTQVEGLTVRVDMALKGKSHDNKRAVFLGNLDFKTQEEDIRKLFSKCGQVESVRLVRDSTTGIGKGFGYVNFLSEHSVGLAIRLNSQEVCGRKVRVARAVRKAKPGKVMVAGKGKKEEKNNRNFGANKKEYTRSQTFKKAKAAAKPEGKSFQGLSSSNGKTRRRGFNKTEQRNKIIAKKLAQ